MHSSQFAQEETDSDAWYFLSWLSFFAKNLKYAVIVHIFILLLKNSIEMLEIEHRKVLSQLQYRNEELLKDNLVLVDEVERLRNIIAFYEQRDAKAMKQ